MWWKEMWVRRKWRSNRRCRIIHHFTLCDDDRGDVEYWNSGWKRCAYVWVPTDGSFFFFVSNRYSVVAMLVRYIWKCNKRRLKLLYTEIIDIFRVARGRGTKVDHWSLQEVRLRYDFVISAAWSGECKTKTVRMTAIDANHIRRSVMSRNGIVRNLIFSF